MKMYLIQKQVVKEAYRFFMTMLASVFFLVMIFYVSSSSLAENNNNSNLAHYAIALLILIYAVGVPLVIFKNLYHPVNIHHVSSFPMTRFEFFFSQYLLGLAFGLLIVLSYTSLTSLLSNTQSQWIFHTTYLMVMFIYYYHLSVFCYWICGNKLFYALMVIFCTIGPLLLFLVYQWVMETFAIGYICPTLSQSGIEIFLPIFNTFTTIADGTVDGYQLFYLSISMVLLILSMVAVRYRHYEKTGQSITFAALGYFIRFVLALLSSCFLLALTASVNQQNDSSTIFISYLVICMIVAYCTEMVFTKNIRVFYSLKYGILLSVLGFFFLNGASHYIALYVPESAEAAAISYGNAVLVEISDQLSINDDTIDTIRNLHQTILDNQEHLYTNNLYSSYPVRILYKTGDKSYSERLYFCDETLYSEAIVPSLSNKEIFNMATAMENSLLSQTDDEQWFIKIIIDDQNYDINTSELRYLFKNYLQQELDAAYNDINQYVLKNTEDDPFMEIMLVEVKDENTYQYLDSGYFPIIENAVIKTFKE